MFYLVGLGNPGEEYELTRHNVGRIFLEEFVKFHKLGDFSEDKKIFSLSVAGKIGKKKVFCLMPETFMNKSGNALKKIITSKKKAEKLIVIHDDIDLALGKYKISVGRGSGGHRGVESIMRVVKTKDFTRVRIGIIPAGAKGKLKKPSGDKLLDFLMAKFKPEETKMLWKVFKSIFADVEKILS